MNIEIKSAEGLGLLAAFAKNVGSKVQRGKVIVPPEYGHGYLHGFNFNEHIRMMIRNYELNEDFAVKRIVEDQSSNMLILNLQHIIADTGPGKHLKTAERPSVLITTRGMNAEVLVPKFTNQRSIIIMIDALYLRKLIGADVESPLLQNILENKQPLLFEHLMYVSLQKVVDDIINANVPEAFNDFYYKVKAEELVCQLLIELVKREQAPVYALNSADIKTLYKVKERILEKLDQPATIEDLATFAGMSASKLKRLFKQVFGKSIFSYYQSFRMQEAARLLREEKYAVSEVGYRLGFTNLSHFTSVFEEHIGTKPKKYSMDTNARP